MEYWKQELYHHGILGQKWGKKNGPPYPLAPNKHSASERKAGWRKSLNKTSNKQDLENIPEGGAGGGISEEDDKILEQLYADLENVIKKTGTSGYELILSDNFSVFLGEAGINVDKLSKEQISRLRQKAIQHYRGNTTTTYKNRPRARQHNVTGPMKEGAFTKRGKVEVVPDWLKEKNEESWVSHSSLYHHGILGMKWGKRNGPPYPLSPGQHSESEKKAGWRKSLGGNGQEIAKVKRIKTPTDKVGAVKSKGLTDGQKKALIIGASAVAVGLAAYGGFKLYQQYGEAKYFLANVDTAKQYLDFQKNTSLKELANNIGDDTLYEWRRESAIDDLNKAKERIDAIQVPINNPFLKKIPDYSKGANTTPSEIKENLLKEVTQAYKEIGDLDSSRQAQVLNQIKQEYTKIPKESINNIVKEYESVPEFKELDDFTKELIEKNASALGI